MKNWSAKVKSLVENLIGWLGLVALFVGVTFIAASVLNGYMGVRQDKTWHDNSLVLMQEIKERHK